MPYAFRLYDTMSKQVKELKPLDPGHLTFYSCGPTVYSFAHIGNFRTFLTADLIVRTAEAIGWDVSYVSNITDVGHLTEDDVADADGEDKMEKALKSKEGEQFKNVWDLSEHYNSEFINDWRSMNLRQPAVRPKATQHMREQIQAIEELIEKGNAYETPTGVYFDISSFEEYGKLSGNTDQDELRKGVRDVKDDDNKKHPADFALWKKDDKHLMQWYSPWGWGFPGWHIECSVMARAYLGDTIDLHAGGEDLRFPHHECEVAQSESLTGKPFANHWTHTRFLQVDGEKMSKSAGNFHTVRGMLEEQGVNPLALRLALISVPYGRPLNFTMQTLKDASNHLNRIGECLKRIEESLGSLDSDGQAAQPFERLYDEALKAMTDDLNTSVAIAKTLEGVKEILRHKDLTESQAEEGLWFLKKINGLLGVVISEYEGFRSQNTEPEEEPVIEGRPISAWIEDRNEARRNKDFAKADEIRNALSDSGYLLADSPEGTTWSAS